MARPRATLRVLDLPELGSGARRWELDCPTGTTGLTLMPRPDLDVTDAVMVIIAAVAHQNTCGRCDLSGLLDQEDQSFREQADRLWDALFAAAMVQRRGRGRRGRTDGRERP